MAASHTTGGLHSHVSSRITEDRSCFKAGACKMAASFSPLPLCRGGLHRQVSITQHRRRFHGSRKHCFADPFYPRLVLLQLSYASQSKLIPGTHPHGSRSRTLKWGSRKGPQVWAGLSNDSMLEDGEVDVDDASTFKGVKNGRNLTENFSTRDAEIGSFQEILHEMHETQEPNFAANFASEEDASLSHDNLTWLQKHFFMIAGPIVKVLSGAHLNKPIQKHKQQEDQTSWSPLKVLTGSLPPEYHRWRIGQKLRQAETDFFIVSF